MGTPELQRTLRIVMSHFQPGVQVEKVVGDGKDARLLWGVSTSEEPKGENVFSVLDQSSVPGHLVPASSFDELFEEGAVRVAVGEWSEFYTILGPHWRAGAIRWQLV